MKFSNTFKIIWWICLILVCGGLFYWRLDPISNGNSAPIDIFIFLILVALLLVPIFTEIEFFGIKLKREIEELKTQIKLQFGDLKNEIKNSQVQTIHQSFAGFGKPPTDEELPELEVQVDKILNEKLREYGIESEKILDEKLEVPSNNLKLFQIRYNIESELRRIWEKYNEEFPLSPNKYPLTKIIRELMRYEIIDPELHNILRETLSICNYAIHGEEVSENQIAFVNRNANEIINILKKMN